MSFNETEKKNNHDKHFRLNMNLSKPLLYTITVTLSLSGSRNCTSRRYLLWPSNFRIINPRNVFCGATWPLLTGMFMRRISHDLQQKRLFSPSKSRKLQMLALCAASLTTDHSRRERSLATLNDLPTSPRSSLACLYARECKFLLAETHGIGEDC